MVDRGAKNLILLSRAGPRTEPAIALLEELKHKDVNVVVPACDVSNVQALASVLRECQISKPPIKGCIQGSMALKVSNFTILPSSNMLKLTRLSRMQYSKT